jgi:hypothetical protein
MCVLRKTMRYSRRLLPLLYAFLLFSFAAFCARASFGQAPAASSAQTPVPSAAQPSATPLDQLPPDWSEAVRALAEKIAAALPAHATLSLDVKNISSLSVLDASSIREALQTEAGRRGFRIASAASTAMDVRLTLSERTDSYVWVAEWRGREPQVAIVAVPKAPGTGENGTKDSVRLESKLIWQQPGRLLDFAVLTKPGNSASTIVTLEPGRLRWYSSGEFQKGFSRSIDVFRKKPWPRNAHGIIDVEGKRVLLPEMECPGDIENPKEMRCVPSKDAAFLDGPEFHVAGHNGNESALLGERCDGRFIILTSGSGDWTQPDLIQGFALADLGGQATASGSPIEFDGPIVALHREGTQSAARAVVRNLKTGNYEAYIVTATCNH